MYEICKCVLFACISSVRFDACAYYGIHMRIQVRVRVHDLYAEEERVFFVGDTQSQMKVNQ